MIPQTVETNESTRRFPPFTMLSKAAGSKPVAVTNGTYFIRPGVSFFVAE